MMVNSNVNENDSQLQHQHFMLNSGANVTVRIDLCEPEPPQDRGNVAPL